MMGKPKIRFKGYNEDWEQRKLGETKTFFTDGNYGEAYPKSSDMVDSSIGVPFLTGGNLKNGKLDSSGASYISKEKHELLTSGHLICDDIVIAVRGSLGALGYVNSDNSGWNINSQLAILRTDKEELNGKFLLHFLLSENGQKELLRRQTGTALKQLPIGAIKDVDIPITSIDEQVKIGEYFATLDHLITLHQHKCDEMKKLKKYMLQKMFPQNGKKVPEIRFDGFTNDWEQRKLGEICQVTMGQSPNGSTYSEVPSDYILVQGNADLKDGWVEPRIWTTQKTKTAQAGDLIMSVRAPAGAMGKTAYDVVLGRGVAGIKGNEFVYQSLVKMDSDGYWKKMAAGSTFESINSDVVKNAEMPVPQDIEEQEKIGSYFIRLDHLITLHQHKCDELQNLKKYMLQNMFV